MNVRFWDYVNNGPVKLTIKPNQKLSHHKFERDDEGYSFTAQTWAIENEAVIAELFNEGTDCDGKIQQNSEWFCKFKNLKSGNIDSFDDTVIYPKWELNSKSQRDFFAERMGY